MIEDEQRVQLPRLLQKTLSGNTFLEEARLHPGKLSPTLRMQPLSTATMILPESDPDIVMHDLVELYNQHGSCGIFRVVDIQPAYGKNRSVTLNHALDVLNDAVYPSNTEEFNGTVAAYLTKLLGAQKQKIGNTPYWQLGTVEDTGTWHQEFNYDNILDLIKEITSEHEDYYFTFDFSVFPWRLNLIARNDDVLTEFRASRNIVSCKVTQSDKDQCTRLYLSITTKSTVTEGGKTAGKKSTVTFEVHDDAQGQATWGVIEKKAGIETDKVPASEKAAWVQAYFDRHRDPNVQISISGHDLKEQTGEDIDEMHLARVCRAVLPRYNTTLLERIVEVTYPDALGQPSKVDVSMANKRQTTEDNIASAQKEAKKAGGGGRAAKQQAENNATEIEFQKIRYDLQVLKDEKRFAVIANESWYEQMETGGETLVGKYDGKFEVTARQLTSAFNVTGVAVGEDGMPVIDPQTGEYVFDGSGNTLSSQITQEAAKIRSEVSSTATELRSSITEQANRISLVVEGTGANAHVKPASIIAAITNNSGRLTSSITIDADQVYIGNRTSTTVIAGKCTLDDVTADYISGKIASLSVLNVASISATGNISTSNGYIMAPYFYLGSAGSANNLANSIYALRIDLSGDTYTLKKQSFGNSSWVDVGTFSRATTLTGAWSSGKFTVNASPQGESYWTDLVQGTPSWDGNQCTVPVNAIDSTSGGRSYATGRNIVINASSIYTNGYNDGKPISGTAGSRHGSGYSWDFVITKGDTTTAALTIDCTSIYTDARNGYTLGIFTPAIVTTQGTAHEDITPIGAEYHYTYTHLYKPGSSNTYYSAGSSKTYYEYGGTYSGYKGDGSYIIGRGDSVSVTPCGNPVRFQRHTKSETPTGTWYSIVSSGYDLTYYVGGSSTTYYKGNGTSGYLRGNTMSGYKQGSAVTVIEQGQAVTVTEQGSSQYAYVSDSEGVVVRYAAGTKVTGLYNAGTEVSGTYFTKS